MPSNAGILVHAILGVAVADAVEEPFVAVLGLVEIAQVGRDAAGHASMPWQRAQFWLKPDLPIFSASSIAAIGVLFSQSGPTTVSPVVSTG